MTTLRCYIYGAAEYLRRGKRVTHNEEDRHFQDAFLRDEPTELEIVPHTYRDETMYTIDWTTPAGNLARVVPSYGRYGVGRHMTWQYDQQRPLHINHLWRRNAAPKGGHYFQYAKDDCGLYLGVRDGQPVLVPAAERVAWFTAEEVPAAVPVMVVAGAEAEAEAESDAVAALQARIDALTRENAELRADRDALVRSLKLVA